MLSPVLIPALRAPPRLLADQAWLRRQLPPARAPRHHAPHRWHQDGALGFDFLGGDPESPDALLPMITAWVPLVPCGRDAPGLRYVPERRDTLAPCEPRPPPASATSCSCTAAPCTPPTSPPR
ncbi:MAG: hypothetical protein H6701_06250 [Myxococcales bacterium]|nr:hypothetical protein [Myxococcales bacterium]